MTLAELLHALDERGVNLGVRLVVDAPGDAITDDVREALVEHRGSLLARLGKAAEWDELSAQRWGPALHEPNKPATDDAATWLAEFQRCRQTSMH